MDRHLLRAAENGDANAQFNLGVFYINLGIFQQNGFDNNPRTAVADNRVAAEHWLHAAADQGLPRAQSKLAEIYASGPDRPGHSVKACGWFLVAIAGLRGIHRHAARTEYERIAAPMSATQLAAARRFARAWQPKPAEPAGAISDDARSTEGHA